MEPFQEGIELAFGNALIAGGEPNGNLRISAANVDS